MTPEFVILNAPLLYVSPVPALRCARISLALAPTDVITPVPLLYDNDPSPLCVALMLSLAQASV